MVTVAKTKHTSRFWTIVVTLFFIGVVVRVVEKRDANTTITSDKLSAILADSSFRTKRSDETYHQYIKDQMTVCYRRGDDQCYKNVATLFSSQFSLRDILDIFADSETVPEVFARCHQVTHYLARSEYLRTKELSELLNSCNFTCHGGCYHGGIEEYLQERELLSGQDEEAVRREISTICGTKEQARSPQAFRECVHGLGHGTMYITDGELFEALDLCDALPSQEEREGCYSGVFMENSSSSTNTSHPGRFVKSDDPMYPCNAVSEPYRRMCYRYQSSYFAEITNHDWKKTGELCMRVPPEFRRECFQTIGTNQVGFTQDVQQMIANCEAMPSGEFQDVCLAGVVVSLTGRYVGKPERALEFCSLVAPHRQHVCYTQIGRAIAEWSTDERDDARICALIPNSDGKALCRDGARKTREGE